jgi:Flp pilus assembly protein TadG
MTRRRRSDVTAVRGGNERGAALIMVALSLLVVTALVAIVIDGAVMMTTKTQLQRAADAAALAGASGLIDGDYDLAVDRAITMASLNEAMEDTGPTAVNITDADVTFPEPDMIRVVTHRTEATGDALRMFFRRVVDPASNNTADVTAVAAARAYDVCAAECLKPWSFPDRWDDVNANGEYDAGEPYDPDRTGYLADTDAGQVITLKVGNPQQAIEPGIFFPVDFPPLGGDESPLTGGNWYREWIANCAPYTVGIGDELQLEPGNMVGPTRQGMEELIALDPGAYWDSGSGAILGSAYPVSPRVVLIAAFDPTLPPTSGRNSVTVSKVTAMFIEDTQPGGEVLGRFIETTTQGEACAAGETGGGAGFVQAVVLVQ